MKRVTLFNFSSIFLLIVGVLINTIDATAQYCTASGVCDEYISRVQIGTIDNASGCSGGYSNYTTLSTSLNAGLTYPITVTNGTPYYPLDHCALWIDWNRDNVFDVTNEVIDLGTGVGPYTGNITPPLDASGNYRMRIRIVYNAVPNPCGASPYGETEDYTINVIPAVPMSFISSTVLQADTNGVKPGGLNKKILCIKIVTTGILDPLSVSSFSLNTNGSTNPSGDIYSAKLFYTGTKNALSTANQFGPTILNPSGDFIIGSTQQLAVGTNYFWLVYDIDGGAIIGDYVDAECTQFVIGTDVHIPDVTAPPGNRQIRDFVRWNVQMRFVPDTTITTQAGVETDGTFIYAAEFNSPNIHKYDLSGNLISTFTIPGVGSTGVGLLDLAYDGYYFYGGLGDVTSGYLVPGSTIYQMDFNTQTLYGTIECPTGTLVSGIAYDANNDAFWIGAGGSHLYCINRDGLEINRILASQHLLHGIFGLAYDNRSPGGPYLWDFDQGIINNECKLYSVNIATGVSTFEHNAATDVAEGMPGAIAGGLFTYPNLFGNFFSLGGLVQSNPDVIFSYELDKLLPPGGMEYLSSTAIQATTQPVKRATTNQAIIGIKVETTGSLSPIYVSSFTFNTNGCTNPNDLLNAKVWYTGSNNVFSQSAQFGNVYLQPNGTFTINSVQTLLEGTNYFWLTYDIAYTASLGDVVDARCTSLIVGGDTKTPADTAPDGNREIVYFVPWEVQYNFDLTNPAGVVNLCGVESNGTYIYASKFNGNSFVKFNTSGNYIGTFTIPGTTGIRDLAYDGTYFYGGNATNKIYKMNFTTQTLVDSISCPAGTYVSSIAYDSQNDAFWVSSGNSAIKLISRSGIQLDIIPAANHGLQWIIGSAYDHWSEGGPYLWLFDMGVNQNVSNIVQLKLSTKMPTGLVHDVTQDVAPAGSSAKGLFAKENLFQGTVTLGGIYWSPTYDGTFGYAIASTVPPLPLPQLVSPANYATDVDVNTPFTWTASTGASKYHIQVSTTPAFTSTVIDAFSTTTSYQASGLAYNTPYLWRVKALNDTSSSPWTDAWLFTTTMGNQTPWTFVRTTDSAQVIIPANINPMIGNRPFMQNDAIGFFYTDNNGALACGGFGVWNNNTLTVSVYGDNPLTTIKDGFAANETFTLKVWDAQALKEYPASATYLVGPDNYQSGAFSLLGSLYVYTTDTLHLNLQQGWNMVSSYFTPLTPNLFTLFDGFTSDVRIMKNGGGQNFIPAYNINTIGDWNVTDGYQISMTNSHVLDIVGVKVTPESTPLNLVSGWNLVSYLRSSSMAVAQALADLDGNLIICKNGLGEMYVPAWNVNSLGNMVPGDGYFMFTTNAQTFNYPANGALKSIVDETNITRPVMLKPTINRTGSDVSILLSVPGSQNGDEVGVWNQDGTLIGSGVVINGLAAITAWGDDESTPAKEGAAEGEPLTLKLLNNANKTLSDINPINITNLVNNDVLGILTFSRNGIYKVDAEVINMPDATLRIATSPNPVSQTLKIDFNLPTGGNYDLSIFDVTGNKIGSISQSTGIQGMNTQYFDCGSLVDGVYNVVLTFGSSKQVQKISVVR